MSGRMVVDLIENYAKSTAANSESTPGRRNQRRTTAAVQQLELEAAELRRTLLMVSDLATCALYSCQTAS
jgi:hypothetical protein